VGNAARLRKKQARADAKYNKKILISQAEIDRQLQELHEKLLLKELDIHYSINVPLWLRRCLWTMHSRYGWGKKRLNDFLKELIEEHKCINEQYISDEDIEKELKKIGVIVNMGGKK
jgi:hypothetical protein